MKHFKLLILFLFLSGWTNELVHAQCSPTLREIYDFEVGDQFFYRVTLRGDDGGRTYYTYFYEDYKITDKYISGDTIRYIRISDSGVIDTILLVDSSKHDLNKCDSSFAQVNMYLDFYDGIVAIYSPIYTYKDSSNRNFKKIGTMWRNEFYEKDSLDRYVKSNRIEEHFSIAFAEGLGLYTKEQFIFEGGEYYELQKRIRGTDTISIKLNTPEQELSNAITVYPNPAVTQCTVKSSLQIEEIVVLNAHGQTQHIDVLERHQKTATLDTKNLAAGIYHIRIQTSYGYAIKKFVKL